RPYGRPGCPVLMLPFALTVKLGRYPKRTYRNTSINRTRCAAFLYSASSFTPGTLDGVVVISNSFLAQCPQKPVSSTPSLLKLAQNQQPARVAAIPEQGRAAAAAPQP